MSPAITSVIAGVPVPGAPGGRLESVNPAALREVVAEVELGDAGTLAAAARAARAAQPGWADVPAPVRGRAIAHIGRLVEANAAALAALVTREIGKPYAEALGEVREIVDTCDFFLGEGRRLYGQTVPSEMPDKQLFTFRDPVGVVAVDHRGQLPGRRAVLVPHPGPAVRQRRGVEAGRVLRRLRRGAVRADRARRRAARRGAQPGLRRRRDHLHRPGAGAGGGHCRQDRLHRLLRRRVARSASWPGGTCSRACLELGGKNPMVVTPGADLDLAAEARAVLRVRHGRPALHLARHGHRAPRRAR